MMLMTDEYWVNIRICK